MAIDNASLTALQESAHQYRTDLVRLPILALERSTRFMTLRPGVRYKETVFAPDFNAQLMPYKNAERASVNGGFNPRTLETQFGAAFFDFDPNQIISSILGHRASQAGDDKKNTVSAREICASVVKNIGASLNASLFNAKVSDTGKTTATLFNGFDTIVDAEIAAGNISEAKGNLVKLTEKLTSANADKLLKGALRKAAPELRDQECFLYCPFDVVDDYNDNYLLTHQNVIYNKEYEQTVLEGSNGLVTFAPLVGKTGSKYLFITPKSNMLVGCDQMSDTERFEVNKYEPKLLTGELYMFIGTQFESIDPRRLLVIELYTETKPSGGGTSGGTTQGGGTSNNG